MAYTIDLGNDAFLTKIDQLRSTNVGELVPLPQVIVVGDQSSGKSSVLESLTGLAFPRAVKLCTRYATQISCIRAPESRTVVSIIPRPEADDKLKARLQAFHRELDTMDNFAQIFQEANTAMGIRMEGDRDDNRSAFSEDVLKIEICGPEQTHLTLIDVPGIFAIPTPGLTTNKDKELVRNMVKRYMENTRTIILTVIPCNVDVVSQDILQLAAEADPGGVRTMGVLTKPDLATERAVQDAVLELLRGQRNALKLGYCVVRNRGADDHSSTAAERLTTEKALFQLPPWSTVTSDRLVTLGTGALRTRLRDLVVEISKRALPQVRFDIDARRRVLTDKLAALGPSRADERSQRQHLVDIAMRAQDITKSALYGLYASGNKDSLLEHQPALRLITRITLLNECFSDTFWKRGHTLCFQDGCSDDGETLLAVHHGHIEKKKSSDSDDSSGKESVLELHNLETHREELHDIVAPAYDCPEPAPGPLTALIRDVLLANRGPELGTFNSAVPAVVFAKVTEKWEPLVLAHVSQAIMLVHDYLRQLLAVLCTDTTVRDALWNEILLNALRDRYRAAMDHARFLLRVERHGPPMTLNHSFNSTVQTMRHNHIVEYMSQRVTNEGKKMKSANLRDLPVDKNSSAQVCADVLYTVQSYYRVARKRFVDILCQHVVHYMLLYGPDSPLAILSPGRIMQLGTDQLEAIASEDAVTRNQRRVWERQLASIDEALKVLLN